MTWFPALARNRKAASSRFSRRFANRSPKPTRCGLVHRDIKPSNIFLCDRGGVLDWVKVLDFGLVREFRNPSGAGNEEQEFAGTPSFMPPEAIRNSAANDPRSDLYAVGAIGYFLLTGKSVFEDEDILDLQKKQLTATPAPPSWRTKNKISAELERAILRCLERDPELRPQSALELRDLFLASPRAADYTPEARAAWWAEFHRQEQSAAEVKTATPSPLPTVKVDFAGRVSGCARRDLRREPARSNLTSILNELHHARFLGALALGFVQDFFPQPQIFRRGLHVFVHVNVFQRAFEAELQRRDELDALAVALRPHVGEPLFLHGFTGMSFSRAFSPTIMPT